MMKASRPFLSAAQLPTRQEKGQRCASGTTTHQTEAQYLYTIGAYGRTEKAILSVGRLDYYAR